MDNMKILIEWHNAQASTFACTAEEWEKIRPILEAGSWERITLATGRSLLCLRYARYIEFLGESEFEVHAKEEIG